MIGSFKAGDGDAVLSDELRWEHPDGDIAAYLNQSFGPGAGATGDHHRPAGFPQLERAAAVFGVAPVFAAPAYPPLPTGQVS